MTGLSKLGLSASQFRFEASAAARARSPQAEIADILSIAARSGLSVLDAATPYPQGETMIREGLPRPSAMRLTVRAARPDRGPDHVEAEARASLVRLGVTRADAIIVQTAADLLGRHGPDLWDKLTDLKDQGLFDKVGISAMASDDPVGLARRFHPDILQAPASLLDQRLLANGALAEVAEMGVEVHLRSIFLQGLLFLPPDRIPAPLKGAASNLSRVRRIIAEGRSDPLQAALSFAMSRARGQCGPRQRDDRGGAIGHCRGRLAPGSGARLGQSGAGRCRQPRSPLAGRLAEILAIIDADLARPRAYETLTAPVLGEPMIWRMVERVRAARTLSKVVVATRRDPSGDALCGYLTRRGVPVYRGEEVDLLGGYAACAKAMGAPSHVAVVEASTPLLDPGLIDEAVRFGLASRAAFVANNGPSTYPLGLEIGVIDAGALAAAALDAAPEERASLSAFVQNRPARFQTAYFRAQRDWSAMDLRAETAGGYAMACEIYGALHPANPQFSLDDVIHHMETRTAPALGAISAG